MNAKKTEVRERVYDIVAGPGKDLLFDACKYAYSKNARIPVEFTVAIAYTMPPSDSGCAYILMALTGIRICGVEYEDGSGESFNLHGFCRADLDSLSGSKDDAVFKPYRFEAYYNTKRREGTISFTEQ